MRKRMINSKYIAVVAISVILSFGEVFTASATKMQVNDAKNKINSLEDEKKKVQSTINELQGMKNDTAAYVKKLDSSLDSLGKELAQLDDNLVKKESDIKTTQQELGVAKETEKKQYDAMKLRIKYMYEKGDTGYIDMILGVKSISELLNKTEYISKISEYDRNMLNKYIEIKEDIATKEQKLQNDRTELLDIKEETKAKQDSVAQLLNEKNKELKSYESKISSAQNQVSEYEKDIKAQENEIVRLEAEIKRKEEEARKEAERKAAEQKKAQEAASKTTTSDKNTTTKKGNTKYIWPCPSSGRITSRYGDREAPTKGASTNHQGIDISAPTGAKIVAAASGEVVLATYSYSAGNYIMISHGGGNYSVYMHCSSLLVSKGASVKQGQTIALVGSTGYSTGSHLHFGIRVGGKYVNPLSYVSP